MSKTRNSRAAWEHFSMTGRIGSYMLYRALRDQPRQDPRH